MGDKVLKPRIRFKGFTEAWEQRKLGEIMNVTSVKRIHQSDWTNSGIRFLRARDIVAREKNEEVEDKLYISKEKYDEYSQISGKVKIGDLLVTGVGTIGVPMLINANKPVYFKDGNIIWFKNENKINGDFLYYSFKSTTIQNFINESAGIGTVGTYTIESGKSTPIYLPIRKKEQVSIGNFLTQIDNLITLHQRKYDKLVDIKKALLEKMFPKNGKNIPEIRFKRFTDTWEQRKLGDDLINVQTGTSLLGTENGKGIPLIKMGNIQHGYFDLSKLEYLEEDIKVENYAIARYGDFLFNTRNTLELVGKSATWIVKTGLYAFNGNIARFIFKDLNTIFFNYLYNTDNVMKQVHARATGTTSVAAIYPKNLNSIEYYLPSKIEQEKIGELFLKIDNLITLHQRKLEKLKNIKKSLLNKMFI